MRRAMTGVRRLNASISVMPNVSNPTEGASMAIAWLIVRTELVDRHASDETHVADCRSASRRNASPCVPSPTISRSASA